MRGLRAAATIVLLTGLAACSQEGSEATDREAPVATWRVVEPPGPEDTQIPLLVTEASCASGQAAEGRIQGPDVTYQPETVVITLRVQYAGDAQECPSNPETPFTLELSEPLGARELVDGGQTQP